MKVKLKQIANIYSGVTFRSRIEATNSGDVRVIQMKDLGGDNVVHLQNTICIENVQPKPHQLVKQGDIIFRSRGQTTTAALIAEQCEKTIVAAPLFKVRPDQSQVTPNYLLWYINQLSTQNYLNSQALGTMLKMISLQSLENLDIYLPAIEKQKLISKINDLALKEQSLLENIKEKRFFCVQKSLKNSI